MPATAAPPSAQSQWAAAHQDVEIATGCSTHLSPHTSHTSQGNKLQLWFTWGWGRASTGQPPLKGWMLCIVQCCTGSSSLFCWPHTRTQLLRDSKRTAEVLQPAQLQADRMLYGGKKGLSHVDLPLHASREGARKGSWSCHIYTWQT